VGEVARHAMARWPTRRRNLDGLASPAVPQTRSGKRRPALLAELDHECAEVAKGAAALAALPMTQTGRHRLPETTGGSLRRVSRQHLVTTYGCTGHGLTIIARQPPRFEAESERIRRRHLNFEIEKQRLDRPACRRHPDEQARLGDGSPQVVREVGTERTD